jgi:hypothetical protein
MGQYEVIEFLRTNSDKFFSEKEIRQALGKSNCEAVLKSLRKFPPQGFVHKKVRSNRSHWTIVYKWRYGSLMNRILDLIRE